MGPPLVVAIKDQKVIIVTFRMALLSISAESGHYIAYICGLDAFSDVRLRILLNLV